MSNSLFLSLKDRLPSNDLYIKDTLDRLTDSQSSRVSMVSLKDPKLGLIFGLCLGLVGVDRFYKGDILLGILKIITFGGFGIWVLVDLFLVYNGIKQDNLRKLQEAIVRS